MRVVDPQSALLTNIEVHKFLKSHPPRKTETKNKAAYDAIDLKNYKEIRQDVIGYVEQVTPYLTAGPPPDQYMKDAVKRLRSYGLTKTEVYTIINLGLGFPQPQPKNDNQDEVNGETDNADAEHTGDAVAQVQIPAPRDSHDASMNEEDLETSPVSGGEALALVIESIEERFPEDVRQDTIADILLILRQCISQAVQSQSTDAEQV